MGEISRSTNSCIIPRNSNFQNKVTCYILYVCRFHTVYSGHLICACAFTRKKINNTIALTNNKSVHAYIILNLLLFSFKHEQTKPICPNTAYSTWIHNYEISFNHWLYPLTIYRPAALMDTHNEYSPFLLNHASSYCCLLCKTWGFVRSAMWMYTDIMHAHRQEMMHKSRRTQKAISNGFRTHTLKCTQRL